MEPPPAPSNVIEVATPRVHRCGGRCAAGSYRRFVERNPDHAAPISERALNAELKALFRAPPAEPRGLTAEQLAREIPERLNIDFLLAGLPERRLEVAVLAEERRAGFVRREVLFRDPEVGEFRGLVMVPDGAGPFPAVVGLHGHRGSDHGFYDRYLGRELAERGYVVALMDFRLFSCGRRESRITRLLLRNGFNLLGLRVYEALVMTRYLRGLGAVDRDRVALMGHSGGSSVARLAVRVSPWFRSVVVDHAVDFRDRCSPLGWIHCETVPALFPIGPDLRDISTLDIPRLEVPYGFRRRELREAILGFFDSELRGAGAEVWGAGPASPR